MRKSVGRDNNHLFFLSPMREEQGETEKIRQSYIHYADAELPQMVLLTNQKPHPQQFLGISTIYILHTLFLTFPSP